MILTAKDFSGFHNIAQDCYSSQDLELFISSFEDRYLCYLLGEELKDLFIADLVDGVPQSQRFLDIYNSFCKQTSKLIGCLCTKDHIYSDGIKSTLACLIYYHYVLHQQLQNTVTGTVMSSNDTSKTASLALVVNLAESRFNTGVGNFKSIQYFIESDKDVYPEYSGCDICYKFNGLF